jgi:hypothetical protein
VSPQVEEALAHEYLLPYHDPGQWLLLVNTDPGLNGSSDRVEDEPVAAPLPAEFFHFDNPTPRDQQLTREQLKRESTPPGFG